MRRDGETVAALVLIAMLAGTVSVSPNGTGYTQSSGEWAVILGGSEGEVCGSIQQTADGGYILAGYTQSYGAGLEDVYLVKTDHEGNTLWSRTFGGPGSDWGNSMQRTADGGYIIVGATQSFGAGLEDFYLIKTDSVGNMLWNKTFGGSSNDHGRSVQQTSDGGYILTGYTRSYGAGRADVYLVKTDLNGDMEWNRSIGGSENEDGYSVLQTVDGGFAMVGHTRSLGAGQDDVYLVKTDSKGKVLWNRTFGGSNIDHGRSVQQTLDGGYIVAGYTQSFGAGLEDVYLIKTDPDGNMTWSRTYGGAEWDTGSSVQQTIDGGYIIAGETQSFGAGRFDVYLVKTDHEGNPHWSRTFGGSDHDHGHSVQQTADRGYIIGGDTHSFGAIGDIYLIKASASDTTPPTTLHDYDGSWHNIYFTITLTANDDWLGVAETYYKINDGPTKTLSRDGQPLIARENANNTLEYWSVDLANNSEEHKFLAEIKLDGTAPVAEAGPSQDVDEGATVTFDGSASLDNMDVVWYDWTFLDETQRTLTGLNPTYTFEAPGNYTVTMEATDAAGNQATDTVIITVLDITRPLADAGSDQTVEEGEPVFFDASGSSDNVEIASYKWDFGDGATGSGVTTTHTYASPGTYTVSLMLEDEAGNSDIDSLTVSVERTRGTSDNTTKIDLSLYITAITAACLLILLLIRQSRR